MQSKWFIVFVGLFALSAIAEPGNGSRQGGGRPDRNDSRGDNSRGGGGRMDPGELDKFRKEFKAFCQENSPARYAEFERQAAKNKNDNEFHSRVLSPLRGGFSWYQELKKIDAELYKIKTDRLKIEDKEFALLMAKKYLDDGERNPPAYLKADKQLTSVQIDAQLKVEGKAYVEIRLKEREYRIAQLEKRIAEEKKNLSTDKNDMDKLVAEHLEQLEKDGLESKSPRGGPGRPDGEGAQRPGER